MINTDPVPPMPATWPALPVAEAVLEHLRTLWRISTTDDQRYALEVLAADIVDQHGPPYAEPVSSSATVASFNGKDWYEMVEDAASQAEDAVRLALSLWKTGAKS